MPLWMIYHPPTAFNSQATKTALAQAITKIYTAANLPPFYVNVLFVPIQPTSFFIGGIPRPSAPSPTAAPGPESSVPFIRITIQNIARTLPNEEIRDRFLGRIDETLKPFVQDMGYDCEYSVEETRRDLWKIDGLVPPMPGTEAEQLWTRENKSSKFEPEKGGLEKGNPWNGEKLEKL
ncbi:putative oxalocrotonate tautomerase [Clohesyomyces aquaticus]|uniref:Putative oxalocrotonate tautomerase n=1 Tax=Clohesyomyces aquaticus TaxID=1231657 RepID=A0A1Y1ZLG6_9PLEO|nr:putative oxalocrotonate tautomerase [Clohesyomyces aquaticus]